MKEEVKKGRAKNEEKLVIKDPILEPYEIRVDSTNHVVIDNTKSVTQAPQAYFSDMPNAIRYIAKQKIKNQKMTINLSQYLSMLEETLSGIKKALSILN